MRVLAACSLGGAGHWRPLVPLLDAARHRGDAVAVIGAPGVGDMVGQDGFEFIAGGEPPESVIAPIREQLPIADPVKASVLGNRELFGRLATAAMLEPMEQVVDRWRPDLILRDPCEYASAIVAARSSTCVAQVAISEGTVEQGAIEVAAPALEAWRPGLVDVLRATPYLTRFPEALDPATFPTTIRYHVPPALDAAPLPDWWPDRSGPLVYVTLGTVLAHMSFAADHYHALAAAFGGLRVRVLLTVGNHLDPDLIEPTPPNVHVERWVDQERVLAQASLVVCHGGSGTVHGSIAAGVPVIVVPSFADQHVNGRSLAAAGLGLVVEASRAEGRHTFDDATGESLRAAVASALDDGALRHRVSLVAQDIRSTPDPRCALESIPGLSA